MAYNAVMERSTMSSRQTIAEFVAERIRYHRQRLGLSQQALADRSQLSLRQIQYLEAAGSWGSDDAFDRILRALDLTPEKFFSGGS